MFRWNLMVRTRFGSHRQETKARRLRKTVRLRLEALEDRTLPSASSLPVVTVASPPAAPQVAAITSFVDSMVQQRLQVIDTIVQDASNIWNTLGQGLIQEVAALQLQVGHILGFDTNTLTPSSNAAASQLSSDRGAGQDLASGSGGGSGAMTPAHEHPHPRLDASADVSGTGTASGSGPYSGSATVTGKVWLDNNGNGSQDQSNVEMDYAGDTVSLFVSTDGGSTWSFKSSTPTSDATQGYNYSLKVAYGYPWPSSYIYKIQVGIPSYFYATTPGTSQIDAQGYSQTFGLSPGGTVYITGGLCSMNVNAVGNAPYSDDPNGPTQQNTVTLRDAIETGDNGGGIGHGSTIEPVTFINPSNGYALTGTITPETPLPDITKSYNIDGSGSSTLFVNANLAPAPPVFRVFKIAAGVEDCINNLTIEGGKVTGYNGGGIFNAGTLTLLDDVVSGNQATGANGNGGGIYNAAGATLTLDNTEVEENSAGGYGGGIDNLGTLTCENGSQIFHVNIAKYGAGIANQGSGATTTLLSTGVSGNVASSSGGGIYNTGGRVSATGSLGGGVQYNSAGVGGGIYVGSGKLTLKSPHVSDNKATTGNGGGIYINNGTATLANTGSVADNSAKNGNGGGIFILAGTLDLTGPAPPAVMTIGGNSAINGGGMLNLPTIGGHSVKGVYSPWEVHHGSNTTHLHC